MTGMYTYIYIYMHVTINISIRFPIELVSLQKKTHLTYIVITNKLRRQVKDLSKCSLVLF